MTFASLAFYLWRQRVSFTDRIAVGQSLLHDPTFHLGKFLTSLVAWTFIIEFLGAAFLFIQAPNIFSPFSALFHAVSAFCNANPLHFHAADGGGYRFLLEQVAELDGANPQLAARLLTPLTRWRKYAPARGELMRGALQELATRPDLSRDVYEIVSKSLR